MAVCQFYVRGTCKFGDSCRNEHPANPPAGGAPFGNSSWNRNSAPGGTVAILSYLFTADSIRDDLTPSKDKPLWPLSSYAPAKWEPVVITGHEESMEELRVKAVAATKANNPNEYLTYESNQIAASQAVYSNALANYQQVYEQAKVQADAKAGAVTKPGPSAFGSASTSAFGAPATTSAFGNPQPTTSAFGAPASTSAFGSTPTPSAFGTPAAPTNTTQSAFGNLGSTGTSAFGGGTFGAPASTSAFGKPAFGQSAFSAAPAATPAAPAATTSAFGQPSFGQSAFGTSAAAGGGSGLIKPASGAFSAFANSGPSAFGSGAPAAGTGTGGGGAFSAFSGAQPSAFAAAAANKPATTTGSVFGQGSFGTPAPGPPANPFGGGGGSVFGTPAPALGAASAFGTPGATTTPQQPAAFSAFGTPQGGGAFGQPQPGVTSAFGQPQTGAPVSAFGGGGPFPSATSPFGTPTSSFQTAATPAQGSFTSAFGSNITNTASTTMGTPSTSTAAAPSNPFGQQNKLDFANARYDYRPGMAPQDRRLPPNYAELLPEAAMSAFKSEKFEWGKVPEWVPPLEVRAKAAAPGQTLFS